MLQSAIYPLDSLFFPIILAELATENGDNWTVAVLECTVNKLRPVLNGLFDKVDALPGIEIPHFSWRGPMGIISFRVLRDPKISDSVANGISDWLRQHGVDFVIDPTIDQKLGGSHKWIRHGEKNPHWNRNRCEFLSQLSRLVVSAAKSGLFEACDRAEFAHMAVNMLFLQEATVLGSNRAYYLDVLTGQTCGWYKTSLIDPS